MGEEKKEVDWSEAAKAAFIGDAIDLLLAPLPLGKFAGDFLDIEQTLPSIRKSLPDADKDVAHLAALAEVLPFVELLPNWGLLVAGSFVREKVIGKEGGAPSPSELFGLPERGTGLKLGTARTGEERGHGKSLTEEERGARHKTIFGELGLPTPEELLSPFKKKE